MIKNLTAIIAGTLITLATGPAFAQGQNVGTAILNLGDDLDALLNLVEPKTIFVTSDEFLGDLVTAANDLGLGGFGPDDGLLAADALCQNLADDVDGGSIVPEGEYVALLSTNDVNAAERITPSSGPYIRPDGVYVSANAAGLFDTRNGHQLINPVSFDESGEEAPGTIDVWTGSFSNGLSRVGSCDGWKAVGPISIRGVRGNTTSTSSTWLDDAQVGCDSEVHLYCVGL